MPGGRLWLPPGKKYIILKNPVRYSYFTHSNVLDSYSMMEVTGNQLPHTIAGMSESRAEINEFVSDVETLRSELGGLSREVYDLSFKSPHQVENWVFESQLEDALVTRFMQKWYLDQVPGTTSSKDTDVPADMTSRRLTDIVSYIIKPMPAFGQAVVVNNTNVAMPLFKMNVRLTNAVSRYLKQNRHSDVFGAIFSQYGRNYRQKYDNVIPHEVNELYTSSLYHGGRMTSNRSPLLDLVMGKELLYRPNMQHVLRDELKRYHDRSYRVRDPEGNIDIITEYGTYNDVRQWLEMYRDPKNFIVEPGTWSCY